MPPVARRRAGLMGRAGLAASLGSVALTFGVAVAGPSAMEPALPGGAGQPPWSFALYLPAGLSIGLAAAALALGSTGLGLCLHAARHGWVVSPRLLLGAGLIAAARTTALAFGYLPARGIALPPALDWTRTVIRTGVTPVLLLGTAVLLVVVFRSEHRTTPAGG
jgi:hypothetical protein